MSYPDRLEITPLSKPPAATMRVPGSKSITNRGLVLAALCTYDCETRLIGALRSEDTEVMIDGLRALGYKVNPDWHADPPVVTVDPPFEGPSGFPADPSLWPPRGCELYVANSGTTMRFLTALVSLGTGRFRVDGVPRMRERPIEDLLVALRQAGVEARSEFGNGCPPVLIEGAGGWQSSHIRIRGDVSSQFLSALLMVAALATPKNAPANAVTIEVDGPLVSQPYVTMTVRMMADWGFPIRQEGNRFEVAHLGAAGWIQPPDFAYRIEPDASAASYFFAAAAVTGGTVRVVGLTRGSLQGDVRLVDALEQMGCAVEADRFGITVRGGPLRGIDVDMNDISDTVMTLGAVACFADGPTTIRNVGHIRYKETDRLAALATELRRVGAGVDEFADGLTITPRQLHGAEIETYNDHRMAMSLALVGLRVPGVVIRNPGCVAKTYPDFFADLEKLR